MNKLILISLITTVAIADPIIVSKPISTNQVVVNPTVAKESEIQAKNQRISNISTQTFTGDVNAYVVNPTNIKRNKDIAITAQMVNGDIYFNLKNNTITRYQISKVALVNINGQECASSSPMVTIMPKVAVGQYFIDKASLNKCYKIAAQAITSAGQYKLINIDSSIDATKYQQYKAGLFAYPIIIEVDYLMSGNNVAIFKPQYLVFAKY